jgi:small subunit ribosomal protein S20
MANSKSAVKRIRQNEVRRQRNRSYRTRMRTAIRKLRTAMTEGDAAKAQELLDPTLVLIDKTASKGIIHDNTAARYKSRLTRAVSAMAS